MTQPFWVAGWAIDGTAAAGAGIDAVHIWAAPAATGVYEFWGEASYGAARPDVASALGDRFLNSGFSFMVAGKVPGLWHVVVYAHSSATGTFSQAQAIDVTLSANPQMWVDSPVSDSTVFQPFGMTGWALDSAAAAGTGIDAVHVWAIPVSGQPEFWGAAQYGGARGDVGAAFGAQFQNSGWSLTVTGRAVGAYQVIVYEHSTVTNAFSNAIVLNLHIETSGHLVIDAPADGASVLQPITISGWTVDRSATSGTGIDAVPIYGSPNVFLGYATLGVPRPDACSTFGAQFVGCGFVLSVPPGTLAPGVNQLTVYAHSAVSGQYDLARMVTVDIDATVAPPIISPSSGTYSSDLTGSISFAAGSTVHFTMDGSEPTEASPLFTGTLSIFRTTTVKAKAYQPGRLPSATASATFELQAVPPVAVPGAGAHDAPLTVTVGVSDPSETIFYTTNGADPAPGGLTIANGGQLTLTEPTTLRLRAYHPYHDPSPIVTYSYAIGLPKPTFSPAAGTYDTVALVTLSHTIPGVTIRYTTDGSTPTASSPEYLGPFYADGTITALASKAGWLDSASATATYLNLQTLNVDAGSLGVVSTAIGAGGVLFSIAGASLALDPTSHKLFVNDIAVPFSVTSDTLSAPGVFTDGLNQVRLAALDTSGGILDTSGRFWYGPKTLPVTVIAADGTAISSPTVSFTIDDALDLTQVGDAGGFTNFAALPSGQTGRLVAAAPNYRPREFDISTNGGSQTIALDLANNDLSQGLSGWTSTSAQIILTDHSEVSTPIVNCPDCVARPGQQGDFAEESGPSATQTVQSGLAIVSGASAADADFYIQTKNTVVPQTITRVFHAVPGTRSATIRYRFQSAEYGYPSPQNDTFLVRLQSAATGTVVQDFTALFALGGLDVNYATPWRTLTLPVSMADDTITATITVANVGDNAGPSWIVVDSITDEVFSWSNTQLLDLIDQSDSAATIRPNKTLSFLSLSPMAAELQSYGGYVRLHGTLTLNGPVGARLSEVWAEIQEDGLTIARAELARAITGSPVRSLLLNVPIPSSGKLVVPLSAPGIAPLLFEVRAQDITANQVVENTKIKFILHAKTADGIEIATYAMRRDYTKIVQAVLPPAKRFGGLDNGDCVGLPSASSKHPENVAPFPCGGDKWARPKVVAWAASVDTVSIGATSATVEWNDFSNMHAGFFPIHAQHRLASEVDGRFAHYTDMDTRTPPGGVAHQEMKQAAARGLLSLLASYGAAIDVIYAGYSTDPKRDDQHKGCSETLDPTDDNEFWKLIKNAPALADGRKPSEIILNAAGHCDHFHVMLNLSKLP